MSEKPSYLSSTLSQMAAGSLAVFLAAMFWLICIKGIKPELVKGAAEIFWRPVEVFGVAYFVRMLPRLNGENKEPDKKPDPVVPNA